MTPSSSNALCAQCFLATYMHIEGEWRGSFLENLLFSPAICLNKLAPPHWVCPLPRWSSLVVTLMTRILRHQQHLSSAASFMRWSRFAPSFGSFRSPLMILWLEWWKFTKVAFLNVSCGGYMWFISITTCCLGFGWFTRVCRTCTGGHSISITLVTGFNECGAATP